jgi:hypothetical protein
MGIDHAEMWDGDRNRAAYHLLQRGVVLPGLQRFWEANCRTKRYKHIFSQGPVPVY